MSENEPGGEYPGREAYDSVEDEARKARGEITSGKPFGEVKEAAQRGEEAEGRMGQMKEMAFDEALALNKQYDELFVKKEQVDEEIATFRREKLGMGEERETEKKEPTLEEQAAIYAEMFGVDTAKIIEAAQNLQVEMSEEEKKELRMLGFAPKGETAAKAWERVKKENPTWQSHNPAKIKTEGETDKALVAFARFGQEADEDSLGESARSAEKWEEDSRKTGQKYMSPKLRMLAGEMYRRATGKQMDERNWTMCPGSRSENGYVPYLGFIPYDGKVDLNDVNPESRSPSFGVRRVVSKELES